MTPGDRPHRSTTVRVAGDEFAGDVTERLHADDFEVVDGEADVLVLCWPQVTQDALADARRLRDGRAGGTVAVIATVPTPFLIRAMTATLDGVVLLGELAATLRPTLVAVAAGQTSHPQAFRAHLDRTLLSTREKQVLAMVVLGLTNAEIGRKLYLTEASVKAHLTSAFAKLGVRSREEATALILDPESGYGPGILRITPEDQR